MSLFVGVMSGTSLDGIDVAVVNFKHSETLELVAAETFPFPAELKQKLLSLITSAQCKLNSLGEIDIELGQLIAACVNQLLTQYDLDYRDISAIGSHGQTVFHNPCPPFPFSMQIGNANVIAQLTGITTIADFRQRDIAVGGQGAPLVPAFHQALFANNKDDRIIVNIGGISNITFLPGASEHAVLGFDSGPGNTLLDAWIQRHQQINYDSHGQWAEQGTCQQELLNLLITEHYFQQAIPKSTGRELFNLDWLDLHLNKLNKDIEAIDVQATLVELTAKTIVHDIVRYCDSADTVYVCGGGVHNNFLISRLESLLQTKVVTSTTTLGLDPDWVEACAFAWLAYKNYSHEPANLPSVTGASMPVILGASYSSNDVS